MRSTCAGLILMTAAITGTARAADPVSEFRAADWRLVTSLAEVPGAVVEAMSVRFRTEERIADRGEEFEATDVVSGAPSRRFVLAGQDDTLWFVAMEQGGYVHQLVLAVIRIGGDASQVTLVARGLAGRHDDSPAGWNVTLDDLRTALDDGTLRVENPPERRE